MVKTLVLGLGNPILSDDSVGIRVARALQERFDIPEVTILEASIAGLDILDMFNGYDRAIVIDAIQTSDGRPGQIYRLEPGVFATTRHASSPHDVNFATALELGKRLGLSLPDDVVIFGIEAVDVITFSESCTPEVERAIPECVEMVIRELTRNTVKEEGVELTA